MTGLKILVPNVLSTFERVGLLCLHSNVLVCFVDIGMCWFALYTYERVCFAVKTFFHHIICMNI